MNKQNNKKNRGFTLIELLVVIAIIGVLSSVVLTSLTSAKQKAQEANIKATDAQIRLVLDAYYASYGQYPVPGGATGSYCVGATSCEIGGVPITDYLVMGSGFDQMIANATKEYRTPYSSLFANIAYADECTISYASDPECHDVDDFDFPATGNFPEIVSGYKGFVYNVPDTSGQAISITSAVVEGNYVRSIASNSGWGCSGGGCSTSGGSGAGTCLAWTYSAWSTCSSGSQSRTVLTSAPSGCTGGSPVLTQSCGGGTCSDPNDCGPGTNSCETNDCGPGSEACYGNGPYGNGQSDPNDCGPGMDESCETNDCGPGTEECYPGGTGDPNDCGPGMDPCYSGSGTGCSELNDTSQSACNAVGCDWTATP